MDQNVGTDRRTLLRGAALAGGVLWAAPAVQVVAAPAFAVGTPPPGVGTGLSYVAVLLRAGSTLYRIKFEDGKAKAEIGEFATPGCAPFPASSVTATGSTVKSVVQSFSFVGGSLVVVLTSGVELVDWVAKQGTCCMTQSGSLSTGYEVVETPGGTTITFPPAPNKAPCSLKAGAATASTPTPVTSSPAATSTADTGEGGGKGSGKKD